MPDAPHLHLSAAVNAAVASQDAIRQAAQQAADEETDRNRQNALAFPDGLPANDNG